MFKHLSHQHWIFTRNNVLWSNFSNIFIHCWPFLVHFCFNYSQEIRYLCVINPGCRSKTESGWLHKVPVLSKSCSSPCLFICLSVCVCQQVCIKLHCFMTLHTYCSRFTVHTYILSAVQQLPASLFAVLFQYVLTSWYCLEARSPVVFIMSQVLQ